MTENALPGAPKLEESLAARLQAALAAKGPGYVPRTHHMVGTAPKYTNRLIHETSPYLLQHAHNPVDWYPWGDEAFAEARRAGQAGVPVDRLLDLPLVPRHGGRVVRGRGDRRAS